MNKLTRLEPALQWLTRLTSGIGLAIGVLGLIFAGGLAGVDLVIYVGSMLLATIAPKWFYLRPRTRGILIVVLLLGFIAPIKVALEEWPSSGDWSQVLQCLPLVLALLLVALRHSTTEPENAP